MGITTIVEDDFGHELGKATDPTNVLHRLLPAAGDERFRCVSMIDWYGVTVFNYLQAQVFLREWSDIAAASRGTPDEAIVLRIAELAERVANGRGYYLKFVGD